MIPSLNSIKKGLNIVHNDEPYLVVEANFVRMQACKPTMQTKLKNLINGKTVEISYHPSDKVEEANLERFKCDYLYNDGENYYFMNEKTFEQFYLPADNIIEAIKYLKDGHKVDVLYFNDMPVLISLPQKVDLKVVSAPEGVKGDSAQGRTTKTAQLETGLEIQVPLFIKEGDTVVIRTDTNQYSERK